MTQTKLAVQSAYQFSRTNPPRVIVPVNKNAVGAHNELLPSTEYELCSEGAKGNRVPVPTPHLVKQVKKSLVHQRRTQYEDPNRAKETPLHPPYESYMTDSIQGKSTFNNGPIAF